MSARQNVSIALVEEIVRGFGEVRLRALGTSMAPSLLHGDMISIRRARLEEIFPGEIILFSQNGRMFVHRLVSRDCAGDTPCLITRGDRLRHNDPPVLPSQILGRVTAVERGHRRFVPDVEVRGWNRLILPVLRASDLATRAYLRFVACLRIFLPAKAHRCRSAISPGETPWAL